MSLRITGNFSRFLLFVGVFAFCLMFGIFLSFSEALAEEDQTVKRVDLEKQIQQLEDQAEVLDKHLKDVQNETQTLANTTKEIETEIKRRELEIKKFSLAIQKAGLEIKKKTEGVIILSEKIEKSRKALGAGLFLLYTYGQDNILTVLLKNKNISEFFDSIDSIEKIGMSVKEHLTGFKEDRTILQKEKLELEDFQEDQQELKSLQEVERRFLAQKKKEKDELLRLTKGKEAVFQQLLQSKKKDIASIRTQLFYLEKTGITAEDALRLADLAAKRAGIRTAFLLALLEVETGKQFEDGQISVGTNLGTGNWQRDLYQCYINLGKRKVAEAEKRAFFEIISKLNFDPDKMPVSRKPRYGCGGAMGPAQFLPTTWLRFENKVAELTGHSPPNPWNVEDAFTASATFLASAGAKSKTTAGETAAAKTYLSGRATCNTATCRWYASTILSLAKSIANIL